MSARVQRDPILMTFPLERLTPIETFERLRSHPDYRPVALLESASLSERIGRYSFIALRPHLRLRSFGSTIELHGAVNETRQGKPLQLLKQWLDQCDSTRPPGAPPFLGGAVGYFGYDLGHFFERLPRQAPDDLGLPDLDVYLVDTVVAFDHQEHTVTIVHRPDLCAGDGVPGHGTPETQRLITALHGTITAERPAPMTQPPAASPRVVITPGQTPRQYQDQVRHALEYIAAGDIFQANLAHRFAFQIGAREPWTIYRRLAEINPSPFAAYLDTPPVTLVGASPERLVSLDRRWVQTRPIAGTRPRSRQRAIDAALAGELLTNPKEQAEHLMLVDLERNDLGRVCEYGTIKVDELMVTERYSHVSHLVSNVTGHLHNHKNWLDLLRAVFPGGTVTGVPKVRCMEIIDELEPVRRGPYSGSVGYLSFSGDLDLNIIIRTLIIAQQTAYLHVGAGVVADSDPAREYAETLLKAQALREAIEAA